MGQYIQAALNLAGPVFSTIGTYWHGVCELQRCQPTSNQMNGRYNRVPAGWWPLGHDRV